MNNTNLSLDMPLINCKVKLKLKSTNYYVLSASGVDNDENKNDKITFTIKETKLYIPAVTLSARDNQKLLKRLSKGFERSVYWNKYKTKKGNKNTANEYRHFLKSNFAKVNWLFALVCLNRKNGVKRFKTSKYYLPKGIGDNYNVFINGKNFYGQAIDSNIKRYEEIRKLTTGQGEDYTTECLLDYDYIKSHYRLIAVA